MLRPLIENGKIRSKWTSKKNVTPLISRFQRQLPPKGKPITKAEFLNLCDMQQSVMERAMPAPQGEGLK